MVNKHMEKMFNITNLTRKMQIKTTVSPPPVRIAIIKKTTNNCWQAHGEVRTLVHYLCTMDYSSMIKKEVLPFSTTWMSPDGIMLSEISLTEKGKYYIVPLICGI